MDSLAALHRKHTPEEYAQLESNILQDGVVLDPIVYWGTNLLDGKTRLEIAKKHNIEYEEIQLDLPDLEAAVNWVINHQLGKRNLSQHEQQRMRAEQAKLLGDTAAVAQQHGVSIRTVQRDVEADEIRSLMSEDVREKCEAGVIINFRRDWKDYADLTEDQRKSVDDTLRTKPGITMRQALPVAGSNMKPEDFQAINDSLLSNSQKQSLSLGTLAVNSDDAQQLARLPRESQEMVRAILEDKECEGLGDALKRLGGRRVPKGNGDKIEKAKEKTAKLIVKVLSSLEDIKALEKPKKLDCVEAGEMAIVKIQAWLEEQA